MTSIGDYLRGYVAGYWAGFDFATDEPGLDELEAAEEEIEGASAAGGASAPTTTPAPDLPQSASRSPSTGAPGGRSAASVVSSLPAIHQPALAGEGEGVALAGELERIHAHRGMVLGLRIAAAEMFRIDLPEAEQAVHALIARNTDIDEVPS